MEGADPGGKETGTTTGECLRALHLLSITSLTLTPYGMQAGHPHAGECLTAGLGVQRKAGCAMSGDLQGVKNYPRG